MNILFGDLQSTRQNLELFGYNRICVWSSLFTFKMRSQCPASPPIIS